MFSETCEMDLAEFKISTDQMLNSKLNFFEDHGIIQFEKNKNAFRVNIETMTKTPLGFSQMEGCNSLFHVLYNIAKVDF